MSVECTADSARNTADDKRLLERQQNTVNSRLRYTENTGDKVGDRHFPQLLILRLKENSQYDCGGCKSTGKERHHHIVIAKRHHIVDVDGDKSPVHSENDENLPGQSYNRTRKQGTETADCQRKLRNQRRTKRCDRPQENHGYRQRHQQCQHRYKEKLHQIRNQFIKELLAFGRKPYRQNDRNDRSRIIHGNYGDSEKVNIYRRSKHGAFQ